MFHDGYILIDLLWRAIDGLVESADKELSSARPVGMLGSILRMGKIWNLGSESKPKQRNLNIHAKVTFRAAA